MRALRLGLAVTVAALMGGAASCASKAEPSATPNDVPDASPDAPVDTGAAPGVVPADAGADANCEDCAWFASTCTSTSMCVVATGVDPTSKLAGITCSATEVWAVGSQGLVVHNDGTKWSQSFLLPPNPQSTAADSLRNVSLRSNGTLWAIGNVYTLYAGPSAADAGPSGFGPIPLTQWGGPSLITLGIWGHPDSPGTAWVVGDFLYRLDSTNAPYALSPYFPLQPGAPFSGKAFALLAVHGATPTGIWTVGAEGLAYHVTNVDSDAPTIEELNTQTSQPLNAVWELSPTDVWALGGNGTIRHYTGNSPLWDIVESPTTETINAVWGASASNLWAVGNAGVVLHYDGTAWQRVVVAGLFGQKVDLSAVWGSGTDRVFAVGQNVILGLGTTEGTAVPK